MMHGLRLNLALKTLHRIKKVAALFAKYQQDMEVVCDAGAIYQAAVTSTNSVALATLDQAEANAASDLTDLDNFIISLGVKLQ
jgi:hypothetical protein